MQRSGGRVELSVARIKVVSVYWAIVVRGIPELLPVNRSVSCLHLNQAGDRSVDEGVIVIVVSLELDGSGCRHSGDDCNKFH